MSKTKKVTYICMAITLLCSIFFNSTYIYAKEEQKKFTPQYVSNYMKKHTKKVVAEYNKKRSKSDPKWKATSVVKQIPVKIVDDKTKDMYIDFNKDNGYMVIDSEGVIIAFKTKGN